VDLELSEKNIQTIYQYSIGKTEMFDSLDKNYQNLFLYYLNDSNSSSLREVITACAANCNWSNKKHGLDGFDKVTNKGKEIKPIICRTGEKKSGGNFNDMTSARYHSFKEENFNIVCSLFCNSRLMYVVEFPFSVINEHMKKRLEKILDDRKNGKEGRTTVSFSHTNYLDYSDLIIHYIDFKNIKQFDCVSKPHLNKLEEHAFKYDQRDLIQFFK
jgi:hypothetical protein